MDEKTDNIVPQISHVITPFKRPEEDPGFLVAKGEFKGTPEEQKDAQRRHIKKLASAIYMAMYNHGYASIRAVGDRAIANAAWALAKAQGFCAVKGIEPCFIVHEDFGNLGPIRNKNHVQGVKCLTFELKGFREFKDGVDKGKFVSKEQ